MVDLMRQNSTEGFFSTPENVISVLDGDQAEYRYARRPNVYCIPFLSVEKAIFAEYKAGRFCRNWRLILDLIRPRIFVRQ